MEENTRVILLIKKQSTTGWCDEELKHSKFSKVVIFLKVYLKRCIMLFFNPFRVTFIPKTFFLTYLFHKTVYNISDNRS